MNNINFSELSLVELINNITGKEEVSENIVNECSEYSASLLDNVLATLTPSKKKIVLSVLELKKRSEMLANKVEKVQNSADVYNLCNDISNNDREVFKVIALNAASKVIASKVLFLGGYTSTVADVRIIFKYLLDKKAVAFVVAHNHPSGNPIPSHQDNVLTGSLKQASTLLNIKLLDHIIVTNIFNKYYSFADEGKL